MEPKCVPQLCLRPLRVTRRSDKGHFFPCPQLQSQKSLRKLTRPRSLLAFKWRISARVARVQLVTFTSSKSFVTSYTEFEIKIRSMAALLRRVTSLGQLILQFMRCVIFHREKDKEDELQRKISVAKEETFFDICGFKESDEHSTTDREYGSSKGRDQALAVEKKSRPRKKKRLEKIRFLRLRRSHGKNPAMTKVQRNLTHR